MWISDCYTRIEKLSLYKKGNESYPNELKKYVENTPPLNGNTLTKYWISLSNEFPLLSKCALTYLHIPISTVAVESSFEKYRKILNQRTSWKAENVKMWVYCHLNSTIESQLILEKKNEELDSDSDPECSESSDSDNEESIE